MSPTRYLLFVFGFFAAFGVAAGALAFSQAGRPTARGYANCIYIQKKIELSSKIASPKLLVIGGSNAAAGIDASTLGEALRARAFNFSLFATFSPGFQLFEARKVLRPGDAALLAFEYLAYEYEAPSNALLDTVYSCGVDFWQSLTWTGRLRYVFALRPQRFFSTLSLNRATMDKAQDMVRRQIADDGDLGEPFPDPTPQSGDHTPLLVRYRADSLGVTQITDFVRWAKANGIAVFATWPNTLYFTEYEHNPAFGQIADFYRSLGVPVVGEPGDAMVSYDFLAETIYHLTVDGIALRTQRLIELLKNNPVFETWGKNAPAPLPDGGDPITN